MSDDDSRSSDSGTDSDSERGSRSTSPAPKKAQTPTVAPVSSANNVFKNDGSFMEMFKKMQDRQQNNSSQKSDGSSASGSASINIKTEDECSSADSTLKKTSFGLVGKRRGGRTLPTGMVKKVKKGDQEEEGEENDAWSRYLNEVKKYREQSCEEEGKRRPLVK